MTLPPDVADAATTSPLGISSMRMGTTAAFGDVARFRRHQDAGKGERNERFLGEGI
jgi:hypothetical protein